MSANNKLPHQDRSGSYITFTSGAATFALPVIYVRYITAKNDIKIRPAPAAKGRSKMLFDFESKPTVLYRFCEIINETSKVDESLELIKLLASRKQDHIDWMQSLEQSIETGQPFTKATDPHKCAFGLWYDKYSPDDPELKEIMKAFDRPHKHIHALAEKLIDKATTKAGKTHAKQQLALEKSTTLKSLLTLFDRAERRLEDMIKPVVIVVGFEGENFGLEVEHISDIVDFTDKHWLEDQLPKLDTPFHDGFFQSSKGELYFNIIPKRLKQCAENKKAK